MLMASSIPVPVALTNRASPLNGARREAVNVRGHKQKTAQTCRTVYAAKFYVGKPASDRCRKRLTAADAKRRRAGSARCAFLIQGAVRPGNAQFEGRISMSRCVRTSASSDSSWDKSASSWDTCASTSISRSSASTWETRASASASFRCPVGSIPGDATGQSRCNLAGSTSRSAYAMVVSPLPPDHPR
jgi:hypothetical protein